MTAEAPLYNSLSAEARTLLDQAMAHLAEGCDPASHLVTERLEGTPYRSVRSTMYYALGLLICKGREAAGEAEALAGAVLDLQLNDPAEIWHGTFRHPDDPPPARGLAPWHRVTPEARYLADLSWEAITARYAGLLEADPALAPRAAEIEGLLRQALVDTLPVVWDTYEPNLREFIGMTLAMMLEHFASLLSPAFVRRCEEAGRLLTEGAISRVKAGLTPLNTNIRIMYVFVLDWFGRRLKTETWQEEALRMAESLLKDYSEYHAVAEYNSPTYCGVDLATLGFWRRYCPSPRLHVIADELEAGIWRDMAAFYNPALRNFSGPYSRCYEMDMAVHTCFCDLLYLGLGEARFPWHPLNIESVINPLNVLGDIRIPEDVIPLLTEEQGERMVRRTFRELSERGDPADNQALCEATAWITPRLMLGALSGSRNPSYQLHPLTVLWRAKEGLGAIRLLRCLPDGSMAHLHTVLFDGEAGPNTLRMRVANQCRRPVLAYYEITCPGLDAARLTPARWNLPGLTVQLRTDAPVPEIRAVSGDTVRVCYPLRPSESLSFEADVSLNDEA
ncbi:MAG: hypothetical protein IKP40_09860 [Clostridia bacterium]|nr:hypothetical protein [Clostridia bacterium]